MKFIGITGMLILLQFCLVAQPQGEGRLMVIQDPRVDTVLAHYEALRLQIMENPDSKAIPGYRIQIFFDSGSNSSDRAREAQTGFQEKYPDIPAYISWKAPNYRVRVGDFRARLDAEHALQSILPDYPNAWVIKDEINFPLIN